MKKAASRKPPTGAPEGTTWFGGPVDRWKVALRVYGEELDPDGISALLGCEPSSAVRRGTPFPKSGRWILEIDSKDCDENDDVDNSLRMLLARLPSDPDVWVSLANSHRVDVFCGLFLNSPNRGFEISAEVSRLLVDRGLHIGFDLYSILRRGQTKFSPAIGARRDASLAAVHLRRQWPRRLVREPEIYSFLGGVEVGLEVFLDDVERRACLAVQSRTAQRVIEDKLWPVRPGSARPRHPRPRSARY